MCQFVLHLQIISVILVNNQCGLSFFIYLPTGLIRVQDFLKESEKNNWIIRLYQVSNQLYRDVFWEIKQTHINNVLLDVGRDNLFVAFKHVSLVNFQSISTQIRQTRCPIFQNILLSDFEWPLTFF